MPQLHIWIKPRAVIDELDMKIALLSTIAILIAPTGLRLAPPNIDPIHKFAWSENIGWTNWLSDAPNPGDGVIVSPDFLAGFIWAENIGWINLGNGGGPYDNDPQASSTFGVNINFLTGDMFGKAWGENIGWINFDTRATQGATSQQARFDYCENRFRGYAWGENIGWVNLDDAMNFVAMGPNCQPGDIACDGLIGLLDYSKFPAAITGPDQSASCPLYDANSDGDVDLRDFAEFQAVFTGP